MASSLKEGYQKFSAILKKEGYFDKGSNENFNEYLLIANNKALVSSNNLECVLVGTPSGANTCDGNGQSLEGDLITKIMIGWSLR